MRGRPGPGVKGEMRLYVLFPNRTTFASVLAASPIFSISSRLPYARTLARLVASRLRFLKLARADENRAVRFRVTSQVFAPRLLLDGLTVFLKRFLFVRLVVSAEMIV